MRAIFAMYVELGSLLPVVHRDEHGWTLKRWTTREGKIAGGKPFTRPRFHQLLTNVIYTGQVRHRGEIYPGEHEAILDREMWEKVHAQLKANAPGSTRNFAEQAWRAAEGRGPVRHLQTSAWSTPMAHQRGWTQCANAVGIGAGVGTGGGRSDPGDRPESWPRRFGSLTDCGANSPRASRSS